MSKKTPEFEPKEILEKIPEHWHPKKKRAYAIFEIKRIIELLGVDNVNKAVLARKYGVDWKTIDRYYTSIIKALDRESIDIIATKAEKRIEKAFERLATIAADPSKSASDRIAAEREIGNFIERQNKILESYGRKAITPSQIDIRGDSTLLNQLYEKHHGKRGNNSGQGNS